MPPLTDQFDEMGPICPPTELKPTAVRTAAEPAVMVPGFQGWISIRLKTPGEMLTSAYPLTVSSVLFAYTR